jgi:ABC-type transporter Mla subunit MlaD
MKKLLIAIAAVAAIVVVVVLATGGDGEEDAYVVRGIFDNSSFMVEGEEVRIAGATVGEIESVDVTMPGEIDSMPSEHASFDEGRAVPGKAVVVMKITDEGFQNFRRDASCLIRPQSLIGEKFVDCRPSLPYATPSQAAKGLWKIPDGQPGSGQYLLPVENNSTSVDPDLVNNIQRLPYSQRFRLILNEFGAGLAGRGEDIEAAVKRANPVLRDADRLFAILANQRDQLKQLAADSEEILVPLARERAHFAGFFNNAGATAEATAERGADLEESLRKLPTFMREFRSTLRSLQGFSDAATPVFGELGRAAPSLTKATRALTPFSAASTVSLKSLGASGEAAGPIFREALPIVRKASQLAISGKRPTAEFAKFLVSLKQTKGFDRLLDVIYSGAGSVNEFDQYGHFLRSLVAIVDCLDYQLGVRGACSANFTGEAGASAAVVDWEALYRRVQEETAAEASGGVTAEGPIPPQAPSIGEALPPGESVQPELGEGEGLEESEALGEEQPEAAAQRAVLNYFLAAGR